MPTVAAWVIVTLPALTAEIYGRIAAPVAVKFVGEKTQCEDAVTPLMLALSEVAAVRVIVPEGGPHAAPESASVAIGPVNITQSPDVEVAGPVIRVAPAPGIEGARTTFVPDAC